MRACQSVCMVPANRKCPERVSSLLSHSLHRKSNFIAHLRIEPKHRMFELVLCSLIERFQFRARWLDSFASVMTFSQFTKLILARFSRPTPARIVTEPMPISGPHQM